MFTYFKKILFFSFSLFFLLSCALEKADNEYKKGNYIKSAELVFEYLDKKSGDISKINPKIQNELSSRFSNIISHYKNLSENSPDYTEKLNANLSLFKLYSMIDARSYTKNFYELNKFISEENAESFYNEGEVLNYMIFRKYMDDRNTENALKQIQYLDEFIEYSQKNFNNPVNSEKYRTLAKKSSKSKADLYILAAEISESNRNYRSAENFFKFAGESYSAYDRNYRNSYDKADKNKMLADNQAAKSHYNSGLTLMKEAGNSKNKYRKAYKEFRSSQEYISSYENSVSLMKEAFEKGFIKYRLLPHNTPYNYIIESEMSEIGNNNFSGTPDIIIEYDEDVYYNIHNSHTNTETLKEFGPLKRNSLGDVSQRIQNFQKTVSSKTEVIKVKFSITIRGNLYNNKITDYVTYENPISETIYTGDVPTKYSNSYSGKLLGEKEMRIQVNSELKDKVRRSIRSMVNDLEKY